MKTSDELLSAPLLKIEWAKHHIAELKRQIDSYLSELPFQLWVRDDPEAAQRTYFVKTKKPIPGELPLLIGDAIHNLRSSLDIVVFSMVDNKAPKPEAVQFPFCRRQESFDSTINSRCIKFAGISVVEVVHSLKPYPGGDEILNGLHTLDISDKHRLIIPVGQVSELSIPDLNRLDPAIGISGDSRFRFTSQSGPIIRIDLHFPNRDVRRAAKFIEKKTDVQPIFHICFREGQAFSGRNVCEILDLIVSRVSEVLNLLVNAYVSDH